jgi:hypothetical protein
MSGPSTDPRVAARRRMLALLAVACLLAGGVGGAATGPQAVSVRASEAFAPLLEPALAAFTRETGVRATLEVRSPEPAAGADLVVGDDAELRRALEGGAADVATASDLGYIPWVLVTPSGSPSDVRAAADQADTLFVLGGGLGREARAALGAHLPADRVRQTSDRALLRAARYALVPRTLAGAGEQRPAGVRPLVAVAALVLDSPNAAGGRQLLAFLKSARGQRVLAPFVATAAEVGESDTKGVSQSATASAASVVDWWLPRCSLEHNGYNDPSQVLGAPNAVFLGVKDQYTGIMSLGQGGYVVVDMGAAVTDGPGADVRVFQTTSNEPVTLYGATSPQGPFTLIGLQVSCGVRTGGGVLSGHCDFDLQGTGLTSARYFKIEDGEIYPCLKGGTITEGADIDAIQTLNQ